MIISTSRMNRDKVIGMVLGVFIGDALGAPSECMTPEEIAKRFGRIERYYPAINHPFLPDWEAGKRTDDGQLTEVAMDSLIACGGIELPDIARRHVVAMNESTAGWGGATKESVKRIEQGVHHSMSGKPGATGDGVPMKISPLAPYIEKMSMLDKLDHLRAGTFENQLIGYAMMTHNSDMAIVSGVMQVAAIAYCLRSDTNTFSQAQFIDYVSKIGHVRVSHVVPEVFQIQNANLQVRMKELELLMSTRPSDLRIAETFGGGTFYVYNALPFTFAHFLRSPTIEGLYDVVNAGGDTDTNGSMLGALLGALHGVSVFPSHLVEGLWEKDKIIAKANKFCDMFQI